MDQKHGYFVISLDFELFWGMFDKYTVKEYGPRVLGEQTAIPRMLELFTKYDIHATWATVGMLMARNKEELLSLLPPPELRPTYEDIRVSAYEYLKTANLGEDEKTDPYHFGASLVQKIIATPHQEIANHTFSHYYCIDGHENRAEIFGADLDAHRRVSETYGITTESIVFPRNQMSEEALRVCAQKGIRAYRGNENHALYRPRKDSEQSYIIRIFRLFDHYINISGHHTFQIQNAHIHIASDAVRGASEANDQSVDTYSAGVNERSNKEMHRFCVNVPASRFLRPYMKPLAWLESLRMRRIKNSMTHAAKAGEVFHLWWHPHNFGLNQEENFKNLEEILTHYTYLKSTYGFESASMCDITKFVFEQAV